MKLKLDVWIVVVIALVLVLIAFLLIRRYGKRGIVLALVLATIVAIFLLAILRIQSTALPSIRNDITGLLRNKVYFWKVITETREGVIVESVTQLVEVTP